MLWYGILLGRLINCFNTLRPRLNGHHFPDDIFKRIFLNQNVRIPINISLEFVPKGPVNNIPALFQIMAWHRPGDKPLSVRMCVCASWNILKNKSMNDMQNHLYPGYYPWKCNSLWFYNNRISHFAKQCRGDVSLHNLWKAWKQWPKYLCLKLFLICIIIVSSFV